MTEITAQFYFWKDQLQDDQQCHIIIMPADLEAGGSFKIYDELDMNLKSTGSHQRDSSVN